LLRFNIGSRFDFTYNRFKMLFAPIALFVLIVVLEPIFGNDYAIPLHVFYLMACLFVLWWVYRNELKLLDPFKMIR
jgi:hypothetical protein